MCRSRFIASCTANKRFANMEISQNRKMNGKKNSPKQYDAILMDKTNETTNVSDKKKDK